MQAEFLDIETQVQFSQSKDLRTEETSYVPLPHAKISWRQDNFNRYAHSKL